MGTRACERSGAERSAAQFPLPAQEDVRSAAHRCARALRSKPLRAHLKFPAAPAKSLHAPLKFTSQTPSCYSRGHTSRCCGGGVEGSHVTRFIQSGCLDAPIETHSILREPPTCKPLEAVKIGADWSGVKSPLRPLNLKPLSAPTRSNLFLPLRSTTRSTFRSAYMLWSIYRSKQQPTSRITIVFKRSSTTTMSGVFGDSLRTFSRELSFKFLNQLSCILLFACIVLSPCTLHSSFAVMLTMRS